MARVTAYGRVEAHADQLTERPFVRVYLDTSVYSRPFDDQSQARVALEALALEVIMDWIAAGRVELVVSSVLRHEVARDPNETRRHAVEERVALSAFDVAATHELRGRARALGAVGMKPADALHVACAEAAACAALVTCDDRLIARRWAARVRIVTPTDFVAALEEQSHETHDR